MTYLRAGVQILFLLSAALAVLPVQAHRALADTAGDSALETTSVTLEVTGEPLVKVFDEIERQTPFLFLTPSDKVKVYGAVHLPRGTYTVKEALDHVLKKTPLQYRQKDKYIVIFQSAGNPGRRRAGTNDMSLVAAQAPGLFIHRSLTGDDVKKLVIGFLYMPVRTFQLWQASQASC